MRRRHTDRFKMIVKSSLISYCAREVRQAGYATLVLAYNESMSVHALRNLQYTLVAFKAVEDVVWSR